MSIIPDNYYNILGGIESANNPFARNPRSSASGLYQFTRPTWEGLGFDWKDVFNPSSQNAAVRSLTGQNAQVLSAAGIGINNASLYAAHFLGIGDAKRVLGSDPTKSLKDALGKRWDAVSKANPFLKDMSVGDFGKWLKDKTGENPLSDGMGSILDGAKDALGSIDPVTAARAAMGDPTAWAQIGMNVVGGGDNKDNGIVAWLKEFFSINTAVRFLAVVVGIVLIAAAVAALLYSNKTVRTVVAGVATRGGSLVKGAAAAAA